MSHSFAYYSPGSPLLAPRQFIGRMIADLFESRYLAWRLFVRNVSAQYRQALLGLIWAMIPCGLSTLLFVIVDAPRLLNLGDTEIPYPLFVLVGTLLWQTFVEALNTPLKQVVNSLSMLDKLNFPREALILAGVAEIYFNLMIRSVLLVAAFIYFGTQLSLSVIWAPLGVTVIVLFGLMVGLLLVPIGLLYKDVEKGLGILVNAWFVFTPVIYPISKDTLSSLVKYNPLSPLILVTRDWITGQVPTNLNTFLYLSFFTVALLLMAWAICRIALPHLIQRTGT